MIKIIYPLIVLVLLFQGCSSKQYFEPEDTKYMTVSVKSLNSTIIDHNNDGATLANNKFISKDGISSITLKNNHKFLNKNKGIVLSSDNNGSLIIYDHGIIQKLQFDKPIVSATIDDNLIAFGTNNNTINLYDIKNKKLVFKEYLKISLINDVKIANPIFLKTIILYPTLNGKILIVDKKKYSIIKSINIDPTNDINNIIFLQAIGDSLIAASTKKLFSFVDGKAKIIDTDIKNIIVANKHIYVATLDGTIIKYDEKLNKIKSKKFKFAKFYSLFYSKNLYALESQGFIIKLDNDFKKVNIYDFSFDEDEKVISIDNRLYFEDEYIILK
jgi:hypothetical protein